MLSSGSPTNPVHPNPCFDHLTNLAHPLFLHPGENPVLVLVLPLLFDNNYSQWRHDMLVALETKNNDCFVIGTLPCPAFNDPLHEAWKHCNKMVISWLTRSMTSTLNNMLCGWSLHLIYELIFFNGSLMGISFALSIYSRKFRAIDKMSTISQYYTQLQIL